MGDIRLISNSEVTSWLQCKRKYYYEYFLDREIKQQSEPITMGVIIHAMLEEYYIAKAEDYSEEECREAAHGAFMRAASAAMLDIDVLGKIRALVNGYFDFYEEQDTKYKVVAVETKYASELTEGIALPGTIDLIWQDLEDGKYVVVDHKSSYNFWSDEKVALSPQFPKYIFLLRNDGLDVKYAIINQLRTRSLKGGGELYRRTYVKPTDVKIQNILRQHLMASREILNYRSSNPTEERTTQTLSPLVCGYCGFAALCESQLDGVNTDYLMQQNYMTRTSYGYNQENGYL